MHRNTESETINQTGISQNESDAQASKSIFQNSFSEICTQLALCDDKDFIEDFFNCLFTKAEIEDIGKRWLLVKEIDKGTTQREIAKMFGMSLCRITRGSKMLKQANNAFQKMLDKMNGGK